jgi:hypothetical protein
MSFFLNISGWSVLLVEKTREPGRIIDHLLLVTDKLISDFIMLNLAKGMRGLSWL